MECNKEEEKQGIVQECSILSSYNNLAGNLAGALARENVFNQSGHMSASVAQHSIRPQPPSSYTI